MDKANNRGEQSRPGYGHSRAEVSSSSVPERGAREACGSGKRPEEEGMTAKMVVAFIWGAGGQWTIHKSTHQQRQPPLSDYEDKLTFYGRVKESDLE